jgi:hypothetical protein
MQTFAFTTDENKATFLQRKPDKPEGEQKQQ